MMVNGRVDYRPKRLASRGAGLSYLIKLEIKGKATGNATLPVLAGSRGRPYTVKKIVKKQGLFSC